MPQDPNSDIYKICEKYCDQHQKCPHIKNNKKELCAFYTTMKKLLDYMNSYSNEKDKKIIDDLVEKLKDAGRGRKSRGNAFEEWLEKQLSGTSSTNIKIERNKKTSLLNIPGSKNEFGKYEVDLLYEDKDCCVAIEAKMYFQLQQALLAEALLRYTKCKWIFISFAKFSDHCKRILDTIKENHKGRFKYISIEENLEQPSKAIRKIEKFIQEACNQAQQIAQ